MSALSFAEPIAIARKGESFLPSRSAPSNVTFLSSGARVIVTLLVPSE